MYGAGDEKIGSIVAPLASPKIQKKRGAELRDRFLKSIPAIGKLNDAVKNTLKGKNKRDFLIGVDGRRLHIRAEHSALNTLLQSAGAVLVKFATVIFHWECQKKGFVLGKDYEQVLHVHDEAQFYSRPEIAEEIGKTFVEAIELAGRHFGMRCPTTGEYKTGQSWADTH